MSEKEGLTMAYWYCKLASGHPVHAHYHDKEYGFPTADERVLFERLCLEIMQAGLSWEIVLKKRKALNKAFNGFRVAKVAAYRAKDISRLMKDKSIIRNKRKIQAVIDNANSVLALRKSHRGFAAWLSVHHPQSKAKWVKLFRNTFKFTGGEITGEFLMSIGLLAGAHSPSCPVYGTIERLKKKSRGVKRKQASERRS